MARPWSVTADGVTVTVRLTPKGGRDAIDGVETMSDGRAVLAVRVPHAMERYYEYLRAGGSRMGEIKPPGFHPRGEWPALWHEHFPISV